jgi:hypothetical protein
VTAPVTPRSSTLDYALILGQGRSGTNWLLTLLNQSSLTHCRNEPDELPDSSLRRLTPFRFFIDDPDALEAVFDDAVRGAALTVGPRDHIVRHGKRWLFPGAAGLGTFYLRNRYRLIHKVLRPGYAINGREIPFPRWMTTTGRLERAFHVFKLNAAVGIAGWVFEHRPEVKVLHIVRHPGGFTKSWLTRWVNGEWNRLPGAREENERLARQRLLDLAERDEAWAARLGDVAAMDFVEVELWWWRYCAERIRESGGDRPAYRLLTFEQLAADPPGIAREVFAHCGLPWSDRLANRIARISSSSGQIASAWKDRLEPEVVGTVERVLDGSALSSLWKDAS